MLTDKSEIELVSLYQVSGGDHQYLTELFTRHSDVIYRTAYHIMKNSSDAEDVMQTAYFEMVQGLLRYKHTGSVVGWMLQVVVHNCYDRIRSEKSRKNRERKIMSERAQISSLKNYELTEMIESHLSKLPDIYKVPIALQIIEGLSIKEVAEALEIPEKTIRSQIARGLEKLKVSLQRVGVTASVISMGDLLKEIQKPVVPEVFKTNQYFNSLYQAKAATSTKLAITTSSKGITFQSVMVISLLATFSIGSIFAWLHFSNKSITPIVTASKMTQKWNFESTKDVSSYQDIGIKIGGISIVESMGVNGTNGLMVEAKTLIELDISKFKLPIRITYSADFFASTINSAHVLIKGNYKKDQKVLSFSNLSENNYIQILKNSPNEKLGFTGKSISHVYYVDETRIDRWLAGGRNSLDLGSSLDHKKLLLFIPGKVIIDDLVIESIDKNILPNISKFEKAASIIDYKEGVNEYNIDKEKVELSKNSKTPVLKVRSPETMLSGVKNEVMYPYLSESNRVEWVRLQKISKKWSFEDTNELNDFKLIRGKQMISLANGVGKSNCLATEGDTVIELDISKFKLPIKITFAFDNESSVGKPSNVPYLYKGNYQKDKNLIGFYNLKPSMKIDYEQMPNRNENKNLGFTGFWNSMSIYIASDHIDFWPYDSRTCVFFGESVDNKKLYFNILEKTIIDNLIIESIEEDILPDVSNYKAIAITIPFKKGQNEILLIKETPPLHLDKSSRAKSVTIEIEILESCLGLNKTQNTETISLP